MVINDETEKFAVDGESEEMINSGVADGELSIDDILKEELSEGIPSAESLPVEDCEVYGDTRVLTLSENTASLGTKQLATVIVNKETSFAAKELAATMYDIAQSGKITDALDIAITAIRRSSKTKREALIYLYALTKEIAVLDPSGETSVSFLATNAIMEIYRAYGEQVNDIYTGTVTQTIKNSKAYIVDAFINEYYPLYASTELEAAQGMSFEMMYSDRFLNILFAAIQSGYQNDLNTARNLSIYHKRTREDYKVVDDEYRQNVDAIKRQHELEDIQIMDLFSDKEKADMNKIFETKLREILNQGVNTESIDELKRIVAGIPEKIFDSMSYADIFARLTEHSEKHTKALEEKLDEFIEKLTFPSTSPNISMEHIEEKISDAKAEIIQKIESLRSEGLQSAIPVEVNSSLDASTVVQEDDADLDDILLRQAMGTPANDYQESPKETHSSDGNNNMSTPADVANITSMLDEVLSQIKPLPFIHAIMEQNKELQRELIEIKEGLEKEKYELSKEIMATREAINEIKATLDNDREQTKNFIAKHNL